MILRCVCWSIFLCLIVVKAQVEVKEQGYQNVLISFAPNIPSDKVPELVRFVQDLLEKTSSVLQKAIGIRIATATILIPPSYPAKKIENIAIASSAQLARRPDISVDATEQSPFGQQPVALQHGGCGVPGHQITLPLNFLKSTDEKYPKGKLLAREWLKYRYGVFDENGFKHDPLYPEYYRVHGRTEFTITECTESDVTYTFKQYDEECQIDDLKSFDFCTTEPDKDSTENVTSSLMYFHQKLPNMAHICGKDGRRHLDAVRSKQNALCSGQSIWDVIKSSKDFETPHQPPVDEVPKPIQFSYIQENKPNFIVLLENSENLHEKQEQIRFALRRLYYDLPPGSSLAIFTYTNEVAAPFPYGILPTQDKRNRLTTIADFLYSQKDICTSCGLAMATKLLLQLNSEVEKISLLLITASSLDKVPEFPDKLKSSGICLNVLRFHDEKDPVDKSYEALDKSFSCFAYNPVLKNLEDTQIFTSLYSFLKNRVPVSNDDFEIKTVVSEKMSGSKPVTIPQDATVSFYSLWLAKAFAVSSINCTANGTDVTLRADMKGTDIASFTFDPVNTDITCRLTSTKQAPILTQVQATTQRGHYFVFDTWIHDMSTEKEQLPIKIYAKIYFGGYPVKGSNVTTIVTSANNPDQIVTILDNGRGEPDVTEGDGVYSGIFTGFLTAGEYHIKVHVDDSNGQAKIGKEYPDLTSNACCGSKITSKDDVVPAFDMEKILLYTAKNKRPDDGYQPFRVTDLEVKVFNVSGMIILGWMEQGGEKVKSYDLKMFQSREDAIKNFDTAGMELNSSAIFKADDDKINLYILYIKDLDNGTAYYAAVRSRNEFNKLSEISNLAEFYLPKDFPTTTVATTVASSTTTKITDGNGNKPGLSSGSITGIVVGVVAGIVVLCILAYVAYFYFVQKPKRREEARVRQGVENGGGPFSPPSGN